MDEIYKLVELAQQGDRAAYGELVQRCQPIVYAKAIARLRNPLEAQELAQEVFIHAWTKLAQLRDLNCFVGWLCQITVRMAINRVTRRLPLQGIEPEVLQNATAAAATPLDTLVREEENAELWVGLKRLKAIDRETLVAFYIRGQSLKEMSEEFETPVGTIKRRLHVARNRLRQQLEQAEAGTGKRGRKDKGHKRELACV